MQTSQKRSCAHSDSCSEGSSPLTTSGPRNPSRRTFLVGCLATGLTSLSPVVAASPSPALLEPLPWPPPETYLRLKALLERGELVWLESDGEGTFAQATIASRLSAPASSVYTLAANPENYRRMSPSVSELEVLELGLDRGRYRTAVRVPFGSIRSTVSMSMRPPDRIDTHFVEGDLQTGSFRWDFVADGETESAAFYTLKTDIREAGWTVRQLVKARPEMQHGGNAGTGLITLWGLRRVLAGGSLERQKREPSPWATRAVELPQRLGDGGLRWTELLPMLQRGPLIQVESTPGGRLKHVTVFAWARAPRARVLELAASPELQPLYVSHVKKVTILEQSSGRMRFQTVFELMGLPYKQVEELQIFSDRVEQRTLEGDMEGAASRIEVEELSSGESVIAFSFYMDPSRNGWIMRQIFALDPLVEHIFAISGGYSLAIGLARAAEARERSAQATGPR